MFSHGEPAIGERVAYGPEVAFSNAERQSNPEELLDTEGFRGKKQRAAPSEDSGHRAQAGAEPVDHKAPGEDRESVADEESGHEPTELGVMAGEVQFLEESRVGDDERDVGLVDLGDDPHEQESGRDQEPAAAPRPVAAFVTSVAMIAPAPKPKLSNHPDTKAG